MSRATARWRSARPDATRVLLRRPRHVEQAEAEVAVGAVAYAPPHGTPEAAERRGDAAQVATRWLPGRRLRRAEVCLCAREQPVERARGTAAPETIGRGGGERAAQRSEAGPDRLEADERVVPAAPAVVQASSVKRSASSQSTAAAGQAPFGVPRKAKPTGCAPTASVPVTAPDDVSTTTTVFASAVAT